MKIAIVGAGVVGVSAAYELACAGHQVTVFERRGAVAEGTSFANAGVVAPGYVMPWAAPGVRTKALASLFSTHGAVKLRMPLAASDVAWMWRFSKACAAAVHNPNRLAMHQLAKHSQARMAQITAELALSHDQASGYMVLLRSEKELRHAQGTTALLEAAGVKHSLLDADAARSQEPALCRDTPLAGAIALPDAQVANCRQYTQQLRDAAKARGVRFELRSRIESIIAEEQIKKSGAQTAHGAALLIAEDASFETATTGFAKSEPAALVAQGNGPRREVFDAVVVCAGVESVALLKPLGIELPLRPVWGYSLSAALREPNFHAGNHLPHAPQSGVMDERYKVSISRLGLRLRVAGSAELGGREGHSPKAALATLYKVLEDWFPGAAQMSRVQEWKGARPMLPDGPPLIGPSGVPGVWLNLGHGGSGWALASGSAQVLSDQIAGRTPQVDVTRLQLSRWG